jgi:hypothetical protein
MAEAAGVQADVRGTRRHSIRERKGIRRTNLTSSSSRISSSGIISSRIQRILEAQRIQRIREI